MLEAIRNWLVREGVPMREVHHAPAQTSAESAAARGEELRVGGKALLMRCDDAFALFVLPADRKLDSGAVRRALKLDKLRFASREELWEQTGLVAGSVPPFGKPILPFPLYVDQSIHENERIAFNAGSLTDSMILATADYFRVAQPQHVFAFSTGPS